MPRCARLIVPGLPVHVIQRGADRQACFRAFGDFHVYRRCLRDYSAETGCQIHAYVLMTNHVHLLTTSPTNRAISHMMKAVGQEYAQHFNRQYLRTGPLWEGRFRSSIVESDTYFLTCQRYIELNPVRAGMCVEPGAYKWSSYGCNAVGTEDDLITPHPVYLAISETVEMRRARYRDMFIEQLDSTHIETIRAAARSGAILGSTEFTEQLARATGSRPRRLMRGRPSRLTD